ncbi:MAG TPA: cobaltochelatase subunit CobN, partial [Propionibacteriaceae bacterium]|nr:cobaltochelatase subunit CobN [Propionibacteriaceae bacterium]
MSGVDGRRIALLSTSDTDLLSARASESYYLYANPAKARIDSLADRLARCDLIILRVLGSPQTYADEVAILRGLAKPLVVVGGEQLPDAALMELSSVPIGVAADAHVYLAQGGPQNLRELAGFLSDTVLLTGIG